ncbi:MAG: bifunctional diaminohydroxyphosphoribosylaminopyrimidine deaminase/5-amino-6-(5-phosphoribosylamino)uracil reductase RibD [Candidatus Poseidoniales archaeon]|nr:bifunctional diaminohydroxyphosphoribosylaminopyrimidine deaminase/5-amino-6-(5-phosphoribosylamino)uracil reductase RibD [Candidatus Poseidoniales archaeon]
MMRALELAERGRGQVSPNPPVGCVLAQNGNIIAEGWHDHLGDLHAEQAAIADAEVRSAATEGCTAYVTLEPCNHFGRTPPCTQALLWAGVSEVVVATRDPNPTVRGEGIQVLLDAGITVREGLLEEEAQTQMQAFMHWCEYKRPLVTLKAAMDANGVVDGDSPGRFTSEESLDAAHRLRRQCDAILVGVNTIIRDNPTLDIRRVPLNRSSQPLRIVLDRTLRIPLDAKVLTDDEETVLVHIQPDSRGVALPAGDGGADLSALLDHLGDRGIQELLVEGGPIVWKHFLDEKLVDRAIIIQSSTTLGDGPNSGLAENNLSNSGLKLIGRTNWGGDTIALWSRPNLPWPAQDWP